MSSDATRDPFGWVDGRGVGEGMGKEFSGRTGAGEGWGGWEGGLMANVGVAMTSINDTGRGLEASTAGAPRDEQTHEDDSVCIGPGWKGMDGWGAMGKACSGAGYLTSVLGRRQRVVVGKRAGKEGQARGRKERFDEWN